MSNQKKKSPPNYLTTVDNSKLVYEYGSLKRDLFACKYNRIKYHNLCHKIYVLSVRSDIKIWNPFWARHSKNIDFILRIKYKL